MGIRVSTPSRICLFGEHQDYLGLEVIASAINLRFSAVAQPSDGHLLQIRIRDKSIAELGQKNLEGKYEQYAIDLSAPIVYENKRDYFKSVVKVLRCAGFAVPPATVTMDSEIPIGKGMCSSTTMVLALTAALAALCDRQRASDPAAMALLAWKAEVEEFCEPGGMMDQYASALGGLVHINFAQGTRAERLDAQLSGCFILFDSLQQKDTIRVLGDSKYPTQEALRMLQSDGISSIRDFLRDPALERHLARLDPLHARKVRANIDNYRLQREALALLRSVQVDDKRLGELLNAHQANLRDGLGISTPVIDRIIETALSHGAYGGKFNGSGGGGCLYVYAAPQRAQEIIEAVGRLGYPGMVLQQDTGLRIEEF